VAATPEQAMVLAQLRWELRSSEFPISESHEHFTRRCAAWMCERLREATSWKAWLAEGDEGIAGCVWLQMIEKIANPNGEPEWFAYISSLYVRPAARGQVGTRLLQTCIDWASRRSIEHIVLWPTQRSRSLYQRFGFDTPNDLFLRARQIGETT